MRTKFSRRKFYTHIYGLIDPITKELRYVGKADDINKRFKAHLWECKRHKHTFKNKWLNSIKNKGYLPDIVILEKVINSEWQNCESFWIAYFKMIGCNLTNGTLGGEGNSYGNKMSDETKRKMSIAATGDNNSQRRKTFTDDDRKRMSEISKKRVFTEEYRLNLSKAGKGRIFSEEHRRRISESRKGKPSWNKGKSFSEEAKKNMSRSAKLRTYDSSINLGKYAKGVSGEKHPSFGKHLSEETKRKISEKAKLQKRERDIYGRYI